MRLFGARGRGPVLRLASALEVDLPAAWSVLSQEDGRAAILRPEGPLALRVERICDPWARRSGDLTRHIRFGGDLPDGMRWNPAEGCLFQILDDGYEGTPGPHMVLLDARPFGQDHFYRIECAWPLAAMPSNTREAERLTRRQPYPLLSEGLLPTARLDPDRVAPGESLAGEAVAQTLDGCVTVDLPPGCVCRPAPSPDEPRRHLIEEASGRRDWSLWLATDLLDAGAAALPPDLLERFAYVVKPGAETVAQPRRPDARAYRLFPSPDEVLLAWRLVLDQDGIAVDQEFALRVRRWRRGTRKLFYRMSYPQDCRFDPAVQRRAEDLWQAFLAAAFPGS